MKLSTPNRAGSPIQPVAITKKPNYKSHPRRPSLLIVAAIAISGLLAASMGAKGQAPGDPGFWGTAANFAVISYAGVTNTGPSVIEGNVALSPTPSITGFPPGVVNGTIHYNDAEAVQARIDATAAYNTLAGLTPTANLTGVNLGTQTLTAGVYHFDSSAALDGILTLNTLSDANAIFVFQIGSTLTAGIGSQVVVTGAGAGIDANVFWQVGSSTTLMTNAEFFGNIISLASDTLNTGANVENGRVIALNGAVTLDSNEINPSQVPEPSTWAMLFGGMGVGGFWTRMRCRSRRNRQGGL
ncbi:MAG: ice-binding family protein [Chthoniobacteraceae bacterium]|nr:ice-binding family protein [Chthoniobacteraceae bacterium]